MDFQTFWNGEIMRNFTFVTCSHNDMCKCFIINICLNVASYIYLRNMFLSKNFSLF